MNFIDRGEQAMGENAISLTERLSQAFESKASGIIIYNAQKGDLDEYINNNSGGFSKIITADFDRKKYIYNSDMKCRGLDVVLKKSLSRSFIKRKIKSDEIYVNYLSRFEESLCGETLVVIYDFDVKAPTPYMRHLFTLGAPVIICAKEKINSLPDGFVKIKLPEKSAAYAVAIDLLDERQKQLLMTLCAILYHLDDDTEIISSKSGVFDRESVRFYLGDLYTELDTLEKYNLIEISKSGKITVDASICDYVLSYLSPSADNCPAFMSFVNKICDFSIMQSHKDTYARLCAVNGEYNSFVSSDELRQAYSHFLLTDTERGHKAYNMMMALMLDNEGQHDEAFNCSHLLWRNKDCFLSVMAQYLRDEEKSLCEYSKQICSDEPYGSLYTHGVLAELDIIRVCITLLRNITYDLYRESEYILETLLGAMKNIHMLVMSADGEDEDKARVLADVIRLCYETFALSDVFDECRGYCAFRDKIGESRVFYTCDKESDELYGSSLAIGACETTVLLYEMFRCFLGDFLTISQNTGYSRGGRLVSEYNRQRQSTLLRLYCRITVMLNRQLCGLENFRSDFFVQDNKISPCAFARALDLDKRLALNRHLHNRGFDSGTKTGAQKYSEAVLNALSEGENPLMLVSAVLDIHYPVCEHTYKKLNDNGFVSSVLCHKNMSNHACRILLENLVINYTEANERPEYTRLVEQLIVNLSERVCDGEAFLSRMYHAVCSVYARECLKNYNNLCKDDFLNMLYEKYCLEKGRNCEYCSDYIAKVIYSVGRGRKNGCEKERLIKALKIFLLENDFAYKEGVFSLLCGIYGYGKAKIAYEKVHMSDDTCF